MPLSLMCVAKLLSDPKSKVELASAVFCVVHVVQNTKLKQKIEARMNKFTAILQLQIGMPVESMYDDELSASLF